MKIMKIMKKVLFSFMIEEELPISKRLQPVPHVVAYPQRHAVQKVNFVLERESDSQCQPI